MDEILIECSPGISGDMLLAAFYDLGVPQTVFEKPFIKLGLKDFFSLSFQLAFASFLKNLDDLFVNKR